MVLQIKLKKKKTTLAEGQLKNYYGIKKINNNNNKRNDCNVYKKNY